MAEGGVLLIRLRNNQVETDFGGYFESEAEARERIAGMRGWTYYLVPATKVAIPAAPPPAVGQGTHEVVS